MKRFLSTSFVVLALLVSAAGAAPAAHAQTCPAGFDYDENDGCQPISTGSGTCRYGYVYVDENTGCIPADTPSTLSGLTDSQQSAAAGTVTNPSLGGDMESQFGKVMIWIMTLFAWLVGVAAITLDNAVYYTVVTMGNFIHNLSAVGVSWRILRDIGNIMLIFGFLSVGITTILNVDWYGFTTKMLPMLLVSAVFLNFSLFFTEAIIDTGNLFATQFYTQINGGQPAGVKNFDLVSINNDGISNKIMSQLGLQSIYGDVMRNEKLVIAGNSWVIGFMGIILFLVTAFVMFSLAFVLIARFVVLLFLIIVAPIGWAALAIPKLRNLSDKWWSELFEQTITAPVLLLCLYIALAVITDAQFLTGFGVNQNTGGWTGWITNATGTSNLTGLAAMMLSFLVATGLLLAVVIISKKMSAFGGDLATKFAGKLTFGATAWGLNRTVGRGAHFASRGLRQSKTFNKLNAITGRALSGTLDRVATGTFDVRGSAAFKNIPFGGVAAGDVTKGGFTEARKQNIKEHEAEAKRIEEAHKEAPLKNTTKELEAIAEAEKTRKAAGDAKEAAKSAKNRAQTAKEQAEAQNVKDKAEVERLTSIDKADRDAGRSSSVGGALRAAQQKLAGSETNLATTANDLAKAAVALKGAEEAETKATANKKTADDAAGNRMKTSIRENKIAYAEGINHPLNPITFVAYGPDTSAAARKIIKDANNDKSKKERLADLAKEVIEEEEKEKKTAESGGTAEAPKSAAVTQPPKPPTS